MSEFYRYFKENMEALGLPAPESLFGSVTKAVESAGLILAYVEKFGTRVTVGELIVAGTRLEALATISAMSASYYVGAVIGSLAVATARSLHRAASLSDVLMTARRYELDRPWLEPTLRQWHAIYDSGALSRDLTRLRMMEA
jgi:hypothetical protein